ncbi:ABC transporter substrate-binding protein [Granulicella arctica]|uniref:Iron complex transport system substrate-binding protein n=1 Tax=Granulicella arctica TaxID=940613 RepID=A0A7Y9PHX4_9BACT|nr:helical backbone metal receptor [Granulicella arctica]NYF80055.1 iron complex transport system substrate-binding protein [Granulicella arctica]
MASRLSAQKRPHRIVSTAPSITETLFALGLGDQVVGVSRFCNFPLSVQKLPKVGTYLTPDAEAIARLAPDLVVLQRTSSELTGRLQVLQIPFIQVPHGTLSDVFTAIELIAKAAAIAERAPILINRIKSDLAAIQAKAKGFSSPRVLVVIDRRPGMLTDFTAVGPGNYLEQLLEIAGGTNVLAKAGLPQYPRISLETVFQSDPDVIVDLSGEQESEADRQASSSRTLALWGQNTQLAAVRKGHVFVGTSNALLVPGPRAPEAAQRLFDYLHGGNFRGSAR